MIAFLLTWNPARAPWGERVDLMAALRRGEPARARWGVRTRWIRAGDRLFFIRLGRPPKGIFASGAALAPSYKDHHWDPAQRARGRTSWYVELEFTDMLDTDAGTLLALDRLRQPPLGAVRWTAQGSGHLIPAAVAGALEREWARVLDCSAGS